MAAAPDKEVNINCPSNASVRLKRANIKIYRKKYPVTDVRISSLISLSLYVGIKTPRGWIIFL